MLNWMNESNRNLHFLYAIPVGLVGTVFAAFWIALGMEYKDKLNGGKFDWLDIAATVMGGIVGQLLQIIIILIIKNIWF